MVIVGGFHGTVNGHVLAYVLPSTLVSPDSQEFDVDEACHKHNSQVRTQLFSFPPSLSLCLSPSVGLIKSVIIFFFFLQKHITP